MAESAGERRIVSSEAVRPVGMRLNQLPADPGGGALGGQPDLASSPAEKRAAARAIELHIEPDTRKSGDWADGETGAAVKAFGPKDGRGWFTSGCLKKAHETWGEQVQNLMNRLASEEAALGSTNILLQSTDLGVRASVRGVSPIDEY